MPKPHVPQKKAKPAVAAGGQGLAEMAVQAKQRDALLQRNHVLGEIPSLQFWALNPCPGSGNSTDGGIFLRSRPQDRTQGLAC
jgi:hypothetical protein